MSSSAPPLRTLRLCGELCPRAHPARDGPALAPVREETGGLVGVGPEELVVVFRPAALAPDDRGPDENATLLEVRPLVFRVGELHGPRPPRARAHEEPALLKRLALDRALRRLARLHPPARQVHAARR